MAKRILGGILLVACFSLIRLNAIGMDKLAYNVIYRDNEVGKINIKKLNIKDTLVYSFESRVIIKMLLSVNVYDKMLVSFKGGQLVKAYLYRTLNGKVKVRNYIEWNGKHYQQTDKDDTKSFINHAIQLSTATLYFHEPINQKSIYSEKFQKMIPLLPKGMKRYMLQLPNGNKVYYSYQNGTCSLVEAETEWADLKFVRI